MSDLFNNRRKPSEMVSPRWPAERVKDAETTWGQISNRDHLADEVCWGHESVQEHRRALDDLLSDFDHTESGPAARIEAEDLRRTVAGMRGRAAGPDGWVAEDWLQLPISWWEAASEIWRAVLGGLELPTTWARVGVALIPKGDGISDRPLAIAALIWRAGAAIVARSTTQWAQAVFPPELQGGHRRARSPPMPWQDQFEPRQDTIGSEEARATKQDGANVRKQQQGDRQRRLLGAHPRLELRGKLQAQTPECQESGVHSCAHPACGAYADGEGGTHQVLAAPLLDMGSCACRLGGPACYLEKDDLQKPPTEATGGGERSADLASLWRTS